MSDTLEIVFGLIGGLALFLYGMNSMSDALQKVAGERMKSILSFLTRNRVMGAVAGALVTAVLQSSSATTVMVIGFVSAGLMTLPQAISVIFGANIGTTITAQLMAFKISDYIYPIIFVGFIIYFVSKKDKIKQVGMVIFSFGLLFEGIEIMGSVMKPLASSAFFLNLMESVTDMPVLGVCVGALMTLVVQSSSATIAVLQNFASQAAADGVTSVVGLAGAIPILLGDNIGTTITALLASIGQSKDAKRTAVAHSVFNITGSILFLFLLQPFTAFVKWISPKGNEVDIIARQIANAHMSFNIACTVIWLCLLPLMVKIVYFIVRGEDQKYTVANSPKYLDENMIGQSVPAMHLVSKEILRQSQYSVEMIDNLKEVVSGTGNAAEKSYQNSHQVVKDLQTAISDYITRMFAGGNLTESQAEQTAGLLVVANSIERLADRCDDIAQSTAEIRDSGLKMSDKASAEICKCLDITEDLFVEAMAAAENGSIEQAESVIKDRSKMNRAQKKNTKAHLNRVKNKECDASLTPAYSGIMYNLTRAADSCVVIAEEAMEPPVFVSAEDTGLQDQIKEVEANA